MYKESSLTYIITFFGKLLVTDKIYTGDMDIDFRTFYFFSLIKLCIAKMMYNFCPKTKL